MSIHPAAKQLDPIVQSDRYLLNTKLLSDEISVSEGLPVDRDSVRRNLVLHRLLLHVEQVVSVSGPYALTVDQLNVVIRALESARAKS